MFLAGLFSGIVIFGLLTLFIFPKLLFKVSESKYDMSKTAELITESVKEHNWSLPHQYDLQQILAGKGFEVNPVKVYSLCKPNIASSVLGESTTQHLSAIMPCRISVYEKSNGKTYISRMNAVLIARLLGGKAGSAMIEAGQGSEDILKSLVKA